MAEIFLLTKALVERMAGRVLPVYKIMRSDDTK